MKEKLLPYLRGRTTDADSDAVAAWLRSSVENRRALADLRRLVRAGEGVERRLEPGEPPLAQEVIRMAAARGARSRRRGRGAPAKKTSAGFFRLWLFGGLAVSAVATVVIIERSDSPGDSVGGIGAADVREHATVAGETEMVHLDDGTVIRLGPGSRLRTGSGGSAREATLGGEAFFAVKADAERPFRIVTEAGTAWVLGTRFHLATTHDELSVNVVEGRVALAAENSEVWVSAGQATGLVRGQSQPVVDAPPMRTVAPWLEGYLVFQDTPLRVAMDEIAELYGIEVVIHDRDLSNRTLTMWFNSQPLEEVMTVVCSVVNASCTMGDRIVMMRAAAGGAGS